ncbi:hypothetical protein Bbelb_272350 [Branchiostoma belcheri]|nr:hypothetical protein Bbelb_272350 [Branchiostoma belcheri]
MVGKHRCLGNTTDFQMWPRAVTLARPDCHSWQLPHPAGTGERARPDLVDDTNEDHTFVATNDDEKAEGLNKFFVSTFTKENTQSISEPTQRVYEEDLNSINVSVEDVSRRLKNLNPNKSPGPDNIHPRILKEIAEVLETPLQIIFTKSLKEGKLPREWKIGHITPIFRKGSKKSPSNYRPVSLTSVTGKVLDRIVRDRIVDHMKSNELFTKHQHGFLPGRSTVTQILECLEDWTESLDGGEPTDVIYLDFRKAFDSVPIQRLLTKIASYGIKGKLLQWIASFLSDRKQRVCVNAVLSSWAEVTSGVPQRSILGPVLFTVFVKDMPEAVTSQLKLFADDTKMYCPVTQEKHCEELQANLYKLEECNRVVTWWNSLPEEVVSAPSVNSFKNRLDKHMRSHPVVYNPRALDNQPPQDDHVYAVNYKERLKVEENFLPRRKMYSTLLPVPMAGQMTTAAISSSSFHILPFCRAELDCDATSARCYNYTQGQGYTTLIGAGQGLTS